MRAPILAICVLIAFACTGTGGRAQETAAPAEPPIEGDVAVGEELFNAFGCWQCHGYQGQGGGAGPRVGPDPLPWAVFEVFMREPTGSMPPYRAQVASREQLAHIHAFLRARPPPNPVTLSLGQPE